MKIRRKRKQEKARVHDRRATDFLAALQGHVAVVEADDPLELGGRIDVVVNLRDDPLRKLKEMQSIDHAQFEAGRQWQRVWEAAEVGSVRSIQLQERVQTSGPTGDSITERQRVAFGELRRANAALGMEGEALVRDILGRRWTLKEAARRRGMDNDYGAKYVGQRFRECLETLAVVFNLVEGGRNRKNA
jgi:hypothetical protein